MTFKLQKPTRPHNIIEWAFMIISSAGGVAIIAGWVAHVAVAAQSKALRPAIIHADSVEVRVTRHVDTLSAVERSERVIGDSVIATKVDDIWRFVVPPSRRRAGK